MLGYVEIILPDRGYPNIGVKYIFYQRWIYSFECERYWLPVSCWQCQLHNYLTQQFEIFQFVNC